MSQEKLFAELATDLYRYAMYKLGNKENAEDVVSETFVRLLQQPEQKKISKPWAIGILRNVIMEKYREIAKSGLDLDENLSPGKMQHEAQALDEELLKLLTAELNNLDNETREVIVLKTWEELKFEEIAQVVNLNVNNVKAKYYRGIDELKMKLNSEDKDKKARSVALPVILLGIAQLAKAQTFTPSAEFLSALWQQTGSGLGNLIINPNNMTSTVKGLLARKLVWAAMTAGVVVVAATAIVGIQLSKPNTPIPNESSHTTENADNSTVPEEIEPEQSIEQKRYVYYDIYFTATGYYKYYLLDLHDYSVQELPEPIVKKHVNPINKAEYSTGTKTTPEGVTTTIYDWGFPDDFGFGGSLEFIGDVEFNPSGTRTIIINTIGLMTPDTNKRAGFLVLDKDDNVIYKGDGEEWAHTSFVYFLDDNQVVLSKQVSRDDGVVSKLVLFNLSTFTESVLVPSYNGYWTEINTSKNMLASWRINYLHTDQHATSSYIKDMAGGEEISIPDISNPMWVNDSTLVALRSIYIEGPVEFTNTAFVKIVLEDDGSYQLEDILTLPVANTLGNYLLLTESEFAYSK